MDGLVENLARVEDLDEEFKLAWPKKRLALLTFLSVRILARKKRKMVFCFLGKMLYNKNTRSYLIRR